MSKKETFITEVENFVEKLSDEAKEYFETLKRPVGVSSKMTDKGKAILQVMREKENGSENMIFKAKDIGEALGVSGRSVSGSMRALVANGYVEKASKDPVTYALTDDGRTYDLDK